MRTVFQRLGRIVFIVTIVFWVASGHNRGWTKTSVQVKSVDSVTGLEGVTLQKQFVPGIDFLAAGLILSAALTGVSLLYKRPARPA